MSTTREAGDDPHQDASGADSNPYAAPQAPIRRRPTRGNRLDIAGRGQRWVAQFINSILGAVSAVPIFLFVSRYSVEDLADARNGSSQTLDVFLWLFLSLLPWLALNAYLIHTRSQSVGKIAMKIKVVADDGSPAGTAKQLFLRWGVTNVLGQVIPLFSLLDALLIFRKTNKCIHDNMAGTIVVNVPS